MNTPFPLVTPTVGTAAGVAVGVAAGVAVDVALGVVRCHVRTSCRYPINVRRIVDASAGATLTSLTDRSTVSVARTRSTPARASFE